MVRLQRPALLLPLILLTTITFAEEKEKEAAALIHRAQQLSDIRAEGAPPFRLKMNFKATRRDGTSLEGVYSEIWVSSELWRREITSGNFRRTVVGKGKKSWHLDNSELPSEIGWVENLTTFRLNSGWLAPEFWKPTKMEDRRRAPQSFRCIVAETPAAAMHSELCFEKASGEIVTRSSSRRKAMGGSSESSCFYTNYQKLGEKIFPAVIQCFADRKPSFEATVLDLSFQSSPDATLFEPLPGGRESINCQETTVPPEIVHQTVPSSAASRDTAVLSVVVGTDGRPRDVKVVRSAGEAFDRSAIEAVTQWQFKPAYGCGEPLEVQVNVEIAFPGH